MRLLLSSIALALALPAAAELRVTAAPACGAVHLVARDVPLRQALEALARELKFELRLEGDAARRVDLELRKPAVELLVRLTRGDNAVIEEGPDPRCPARSRPLRVWLLPPGESVARPRELSPIDQYRKAHGMPLEGDAAASTDPSSPP